RIPAPPPGWVARSSWTIRSARLSASTSPANATVPPSARGPLQAGTGARKPLPLPGRIQRVAAGPTGAGGVGWAVGCEVDEGVGEGGGDGSPVGDGSADGEADSSAGGTDAPGIVDAAG